MDAGATVHYVEEPAVRYVDRRTKVWLECTGDPVDFRSVDVVAIWRPMVDIEMVKFACPRCGETHESLRFR